MPSARRWELMASRMAGEVAGAEAGRVGPAGGGQRVGGGLAGAQRLAQPLQVGPGGAGPVLDDLAQPGRFDAAEVEHAPGGRPAPGGVDAQVQQRHLPHVAGERVEAAVLGPGPVQVPAQVAEQPPGRRVVDHAAGLADHLRVGLAQRGGVAEAARAGSAPRWGPAAAAPGHGVAARRAARRAAVPAARPARTGAPRAGAARRPPRPPARHRCSSAAAAVAAGRGNGTTRAGRCFPGRSRRPGTRAARVSGRARAMNTAIGSVRSLPQQRSCRKHSPPQCRSPSQPGTEHEPRTADGWPAAAARRRSRPSSGPRRTRARRQPSQRPDGRRVAVGHPGVRHGHAAVRALSRSPVNSNVSPSHSPGRQAGSSRARNHATQPWSPGRRPRSPSGADDPQRPPAHRYRPPAATASTARRLSSSRACR